MGPAIALKFDFHLAFLTWIIGLGEGLLLCIVLSVWRFRTGIFRIFISMIAANITSAYFGMLFVKSQYPTQIMGDVTIESLRSVFWTMVCVTFVLTMIIEFPFFLAALYRWKWLIPKALAATAFVHCISYSLLFFFYGGTDSISMVTELEVVPASNFEMKEDYDLYYISPDGKHVLRSNLDGTGKHIFATLDIDGIPDRLCACPRKIIEESPERTGKSRHRMIQSICWESGFDLFVLMNFHEVNETHLLLADFSPYAAVDLRDGAYRHPCDRVTAADFGFFRSFCDTKNWEFESDYWGRLTVFGIKQGYKAYTTARNDAEMRTQARYDKDRGFGCGVHTPFMQWQIRNGSHIAGDYAVFKLGKDQICILDPEKKRIALIARGFGPVVAKPHAETPPEEVKE